jgi:hypothetical protein
MDSPGFAMTISSIAPDHGRLFGTQTALFAEDCCFELTKSRDRGNSLEAAPLCRRSVRLCRPASVIGPSQHGREADKDDGHGKAHNQRVRRHEDLLEILPAR